MRPSSALKSTTLFAVALSYPIYLATGGDVGREALKAKAAVLRAQSTYTLRSDTHGGDCELFGKWDDKSRICNMKRDLLNGESIRIASDGVVLNGQGHQMRGSGTGIALQLIDVKFAGVMNLQISRFSTGIYLQHASENRLLNNSIGDGDVHAIHLTGKSNLNSIVANRIVGFRQHGVGLWSSSGNFIAKNSIENVRDGIRLQSSHGNVVSFNDIRDVKVEGIDLHISTSNRIFLNAVSGSTPIPILDDQGRSEYSLGKMGNFYSRHDSTNSGCRDTNGDGRCDKPYKFAFGTDTGALAVPPAMLDQAHVP